MFVIVHINIIIYTKSAGIDFIYINTIFPVVLLFSVSVWLHCFRWCVVVPSCVVRDGQNLTLIIGSFSNERYYILIIWKHLMMVFMTETCSEC
jgi:hypothetical protein